MFTGQSAETIPHDGSAASNFAQHIESNFATAPLAVAPKVSSSPSPRTAGTGTVIVDRALRIRSADEAFCQWVGVPPLATVEGRLLFETGDLRATAPATREKLQSLFYAAFDESAGKENVPAAAPGTGTCTLHWAWASPGAEDSADEATTDASASDAAAEYVPEVKAQMVSAGNSRLLMLRMTFSAPISEMHAGADVDTLAPQTVTPIATVPIPSAPEASPQGVSHSLYQLFNKARTRARRLVADQGGAAQAEAWQICALVDVLLDLTARLDQPQASFQEASDERQSRVEHTASVALVA